MTLRKMTRLFAGAAVMVAFAASVAAEEKTLTGPGGLTLGANLTLADGKNMADPVVLLLHGTLAHGRMEIIAAQQALLAERGISSLAPTLSLGLDKRKGMYDCAVPHNHKHTDAMVEMDLWLDWMEAEGAKDITVVGHSRGGNQVAWWGAERDRASVSRVILVAPGTWSAEGTARGFKKNHKADLKTMLIAARAMVAAGRGDDMMKGVGLLYCPGADVTAATFVNYYQSEPRRHTPHLIPDIKKPALLVVGSEDTISPNIAAAAEPLADGKKLTFVLVEGAGHFFRDLYGEDLADAIAEFIEG